MVAGLVALQTSIITAATLYVDGQATGASNGTSWSDAFTSLGAALAAGSGANVWVAKGTYSPGPFQLPVNASVYGGFTNGMGALEARNWMANPTVLKGGGPVVSGANGARLDGFTVTGGSAVTGGGIAMSGGSLTVANCNIVSNTATTGGGVFLSGVQATFERNRVVANSAIQEGGGLYAQYYNVAAAGVIRNCVFIGNRCEGAADGKSDAGGIYLYECPYRIESCTLYNNFAGRRSGGIKLYRGTVVPYVIKNCILWNNRTGTPNPAENDGGWEISLQQPDQNVPLYLQLSYTDWTPVGASKFYSFYRDNVNKEVFTHLMEADPAFGNTNAGDLHLKSYAGRWSNGTWVYDTTNSPCIDAGDPLSPFDLEPQPNGGRVDLGAYGNVADASRSGPARAENGFLFNLR
ncbi:MAG: right-handed parallel beta-helix repeat-containing protein [Lentisphaerae bacterium]|nr:right-handed parallel beta-helix repeat-containing protein [Lentisphaerota bacterium]